MEVASEHYPVAVIGSGPIGLTLVNLLGKFGIESLIVERNAATVQEPAADIPDRHNPGTLRRPGRRRRRSAYVSSSMRGDADPSLIPSLQSGGRGLPNQQRDEQP
jgi:2-polyprenyl-6-methoxyphenol hydroxylase-like FAD-dependent oxidoreductase